MAAIRIASWVPELTPQAASGLPARRPRALCQVIAVVTGVAALLCTILFFPEGFGGGVEMRKMLMSLAPWYLTLPWLKRLDLRPVPWFFLCFLLGGLLTPLFVGKVVYRSLSLPYRDWEIESWHRHRIRALRDQAAVVVLDAHDVAPPPPLKRGERRWRKAVAVAWASVLTWFTFLAVLQVTGQLDGGPGEWLKGSWVVVALVVGMGHLAGELVLGYGEPRTPKPSQSVEHTSTL